MTTSEGWIGAFLNNAIDIVEKPSCWLGFNSIFTGAFSLFEYAVKANTWKMNPAAYSFGYPTDTQGQASFQNSKGFFSAPDSSDAYLLFASSERTLDIAKFNTLANTISPELPNAYVKLWDWTSLYVPEYNPNRFYVLGGLLDLSDTAKMNQDITYYDLETQSFSVVMQEFVLPQSEDLRQLPNGYFLTSSNQVVDGQGNVVNMDISNLDLTNLPLVQSYTTAFTNAQEMIVNPNKAPVKWKTTNYSGKGYLLRNSVSNFMEDFYNFDPSMNVFQTISSNVPFNKYDLAFNALADAVYVTSNAGDLFKYHPETNVWNTTSSGSAEAFISAFQTSSQASRDPNASVVSGVEAKTIDASNTNLYFSYGYSPDAYGKFDSQTLSFQQLSARPENDTSTTQWALGVF
jgi:hypothetical protein